MKCNIFDIWNTHRNELKGYVRKRVPDVDDAHDILQTVLIKVTDYCERKNDVDHVKAWIYKIAQHAIVDFYKQTRRETNVDVEHMGLHNTSNYDENVYVWLYSFIDSLPPEYAIPLRLSDIEGKPQKEIAEQLGLTLEATKSRIQRARKKIKSKFNECGVIERSEDQMLEFTVTKACCLP